jgi:hypothetical protein
MRISYSPVDGSTINAFWAMHHPRQGEGLIDTDRSQGSRKWRPSSQEVSDEGRSKITLADGIRVENMQI